MFKSKETVVGFAGGESIRYRYSDDREFTAETAGTGNWSTAVKEVKLLGWQFHIWEEDKTNYGMEVSFDPSTWSVSKDGLIYSDGSFLARVRQWFYRTYDLEISAVNAINWSEQGMQGKDYVHFWIGDLFVDAIDALEVTTYG